MSLTFLFRMVSNLTLAKLCADEKAAQQGRGALEMADFVSYQMISLYGVRALARRNMQELYVGLCDNRHKAHRLLLFASSLGLWAGEELAPPSHAFMLSTLRCIFAVMKGAGAHHFTRRAFFARYAEMKQVWLPVEYLMRGSTPPRRATLPKWRSRYGRGAAAAADLAAPTMAACTEASASDALLKRAAVLAPKMGGDQGFAPLDAWLMRLVAEHRAVADANTQRVRALYAKYDADGNGSFELDEFSAMLSELQPGIESVIVEQLYNSAKGEGGGITADNLEAALFHHRHRERAAGLPRSATLQNAAEVDGELATLASLWDSVRDDVVREEAPVSEEHLEKLIDNWQLVVRVQAAFRGALARARKKRGALRPMRRTRRTTTVRESGGGGAGIGAHRGSVQPKTFSFGM